MISAKVMAVVVSLAIAPLPVTAKTSKPNLDTFFAAYAGPATPGCAIGWEDGKGRIAVRAWGSADLEHGTPITPATIFEAGSVSKQFTAAAVLLLVDEGKLALTDDIRRYLPELTHLDEVVTIDQLLSHTSGLRDWGAMAALGGWPRGTRAYDNDDALVIVARQRALNYAPGTDWSYTNSGYNLLAVIVERVSGQSLASYTRQRMFEPLGMTNTSWRDDFRKVVPGRAIAYDRSAGAWQQDMPFENGYGNGGLLTTVADLLRWNRALSSNELGKFVSEALQARASLTSGRSLEYARGLFVLEYRGAAEISHSGATGGYRAWLGRWPSKSLSLALLCNAGDAKTTMLARQSADAIAFGSPVAAAMAASDARLEGLWVDGRGVPLKIAQSAKGMTADGVPLLTTTALQTRLGKITASSQDELTILGDGQPRHFRRTVAWHPATLELSRFAGSYTSAEADAAYEITVDSEGLSLHHVARPSIQTRLQPVYANAFKGEDILVRFAAAKEGGLEMHVLNDRAWDVVFRPTGSASR